MVSSIRKRDARIVPFDVNKIAQAIFRAASSQGGKDYVLSLKIAAEVLERLNEQFEDAIPDVEQVQDLVEKTLIKSGHARTAKAYILYRHQRTKIREMNTRLMTTIRDLTFKDAKDNDLKRENANIDGDTAMGMMLRYGSESSKQFYEMYILNPKHSLAHKNGDIHIHDLDFLSLTTTCCQIDIKTLFKGGFGTGHGFLREPNDIRSYSALACIAIQANQNDQHGGQSIPNFEYGLAPGVAKTFIKELCLILDLYNMESKDAVKAGLRAYIEENESILDEKGLAFVREILTQHAPALNIDFAVKKALEYTEKAITSDGSAGAQPQHHALPRRSADPSSITTGPTPPPKAAWSSATCCWPPKRASVTATPIFPIHIFM
ncbi:MAG: anaerobic ribonucleoside-triphosphate reductase [Bilophila wadsworthia]